MARVTIGLPVRDGERFLEAAIEAILAQSFRDFALVISDNGSDDRTPEICRGYASRDSRVRYVRNDVNVGAAANFNAVFRGNETEYFKWASHDDVIGRDFLSRCVDALDSRPDAVLSFPQVLLIDERGEFSAGPEYGLEWDAVSPSRRFGEIVLKRHGCQSIFGLIRSEVLSKTPLIGNYVASDRVLLSELALHGQFSEVPEPLFFHRRHPDRAIKMNPKHTDMTAWFDPTRQRKIVLPHFRMFWEYARSLGRAKLSVSERIRCHAHLARWVRAHLSPMRYDLSGATRQLMARRGSRPVRKGGSIT